VFAGFSKQMTHHSSSASSAPATGDEAGRVAHAPDKPDAVGFGDGFADAAKGTEDGQDATGGEDGNVDRTGKGDAEVSAESGGALGAAGAVVDKGAAVAATAGVDGSMVGGVDGPASESDVDPVDEAEDEVAECVRFRGSGKSRPDGSSPSDDGGERGGGNIAGGRGRWTQRDTGHG
jgi:hypothetical protein